MAGIRFGDFSKAKVTVKPSRLRGVHLEDLMSRMKSTLANLPQHGVLALMMLCHGTRLGETRLARWKPHQPGRAGVVHSCRAHQDRRFSTDCH
ncbi:hypothetical protein [Pseudomonas sp. B21-047]|uniref:hypothetical protein n=1 Tax=Pseudomonas sp. B21-047 TaxID=2895489 RepID=UPI002160EBEC|nr:hypothetical protein LOY26_16660 [Pseudomonas sp. B21-047]